ncbi:Hcp family type VI secretion system effector [Pseudoduganella albidiflava]|uniref:Protein hcp1 n=1 Tax=Pseudoduganella albidiflava TaxID=321983 RepID=A0A411WX87_9BURK|nr:type VI secretion system tube protein Hcp [Pseudoduganella albidiflava]QBI01279.1 type VI secretion system tube protein Hcp [Pseudoduganella albidiflava]GGY36941.1 protein hcp1 [Pseudoduganella albidiflava]
MALGDMFLKIDGARQGAIKGEAQDASHRDEIDLLGWSWGMQGNFIHGQAAGKTTVQELKAVKRVDRATTALMSALRSNELLKEVVLTVRKAGGPEAVEYLRIRLEKARITAIATASGTFAGIPELNEEVSIAFSKLAVEYLPQGADGAARGITSFEMDLYEGQ